MLKNMRKKMKAQIREKKRKPKMKVSGKSVFVIKEIITKKAKKSAEK